MQFHLSNRSLAIVLASLTAALAAAAGCNRTAKPPATPAALHATPAGYVGSAACVACHAEEFRRFHGSRHDTTLRPATRVALGAFSPPTGVVPLAGYSMEEKNGQFVLARPASGQNDEQPLTMEMGSGKLGMTYVAVLPGDKLLETKMSFFPPYHLWDTTPGQEVPSPADVQYGRVEDERVARNCIHCHATVVPEHGLAPEPRFMGVGCEACHGPGKAHIDAMATGPHPADIHMERMGAWSSTKLNDMCGSCHRTIKDVDLTSPEANLTHRFQPYALQRSACRQANGDVLSCMGCHNPHTDVSTDIKAYEAICLSCHAASADRPTAHTGQTAAGHAVSGSPPAGLAGKVCPVNPTSGCITCHMRPKPAFPLTSVPAQMADHLISIPPKARGSLPPRGQTTEIKHG